MKHVIGVIVSVLVGVSALVFYTLPDTFADERVSLEDLPSAVRNTMEKQAAGGRIVEVEKETKDGLVVYEAEVQKDGHEIDIVVSASGEFLGRESDDGDEDGDEEGDEDGDEDGDDEEDVRIVFPDLPEAVRDTLNNTYAGVRFSKFSKEMEGGHEVFEASYMDGEIEHELSLTADGYVLESEEGLSYEQLPPAVKLTVDNEFAGMKLEESERVEQTFYEVELEDADGKTVEVKILANGRLLSDH